MSENAPHPVSAGRTHPGLERARNEDAVLCDDRRGVWAVADGMGGHAGGEIASAAVVRSLRRVGEVRVPSQSLIEDVVARLEDAHAAIRSHAARAGLGRIGSTVVCLAAQGTQAAVTWCGDSRAYRLSPRGDLRRVTRDHSVVAEMVAAGLVREAEAETHSQAHVLTRAVGATERLELDVERLSLVPGDRFLLCSDGLTRVVPEAELAVALAGSPSPPSICDRLLDLALRRGAPDNVSAVVVDFP